MKGWGFQAFGIKIDFKVCFSRQINIEIEIKYKNKNEFHRD
jgi:uncharacterized membrane protein